MPLPRAISGLNPFGPIFDKELRTTARRKRTYILRVFYLSSLLLFLLFVYVEAGFMRSYYGNSVAGRQMQQNRLAQEFFGTFAMFSVIAMGVIAPVLTATAISSERLHRTLHVLMMTPITTWQLISGKLLSRLWIALTLLGLSLPVLALVRLLGSIELDQMFAVLCLAVVTALVMASIGLFFSTLMNRAYAVILLSYATGMFLYLFLPMIVGMFLAAAAVNGRFNERFWLPLLAASNPFFTTAFVSFGGPMRSMGIEWWQCALTQFFLAIIFIFFSALALRRLVRNAGEKPLAVKGAASLLPPEPEKGMPPPYLPPPLADMAPHITSSRARSVSDNPVRWREIRRPLMATRTQGLIGGVVCGVLLLVTYIAMAGNRIAGDTQFQGVFAVVFSGLLNLLVCVLAATAIAQEKESDTWTLLLATPLSAREIVLGKLVGVLRRLLWPSILIAVHFFLFTLGGVIRFDSFLLVLWIIFSFNSLWLATGLYLSLRVKKVTFAVILNLILPVLLYGALPLSLVVAVELIFPDALRGSRKLGELGLWPMPYHFLVNAIGRGNQSYHSNDYWLPVVGSTTYADFVQAVLVVGGTMLLLATALLLHLISWFDLIVGRSPQRSSLTVPAHPQPIAS